MKIAVVISAYDNAKALELCLRGYARQQHAPQELWVAEDSQSAPIAEAVQRARTWMDVPIGHLTQADEGFRKCRILNRAIAASQADFLIFTDADCVPRADVVATFAALARRGEFLSAGSHLNIPQAVHAAAVSPETIDSQQVFDARWLHARGVRLPRHRLLGPTGPGRGLAAVLDALSPRNAFVGNLSGAWRHDLLQVAGFDEAMAYGAEDRNLGIRLNHAGVKGRRARHRLVCVHLDHPRSWRHEQTVRANRAWNASLASGVTQPRVSGLSAGGGLNPLTPPSAARFETSASTG